MMKKIAKINLLMLCMVVFIAFACKKERTCVCTNSSATYEAGSVEKTKSQAKKYCKELSAGETTCKLKD